MPVRTLSPELQKVAEEELNEVPSRVEEDLKQIKEWVAKQPHLTVRSDDQLLVSFLRGSKYSLQTTKEKVDNYHTIRGMIPEFFQNRDPLLPQMQEILNANFVMALPKTTGPAGPRILLPLWNATNAETMTFVDLLKVVFMSIDVLMKEDDHVAVSGIVIVVDMKHMSLKYIMQMTPSVIQKIYTTLQRIYPLRIKGIYHTNAPAAMEKIFVITNKFLSPKLKGRVFLYSEANISSLYKDIPQSILPTELGGDGGSTKELGEAWRKKLESYRDWFLEDEKYRTDERLRPGQPKTSADIFGVEGSFRKLEVD